MQELELE
jgi:hypothetical protein